MLRQEGKRLASVQSCVRTHDGNFLVVAVPRVGRKGELISASSPRGYPEGAHVMFEKINGDWRLS